MDSMTRHVYDWLTSPSNPSRRRMTNQAIRGEMCVNPKYIRRAKALLRSEDDQVRRAAQIEKMKREWHLNQAARRLNNEGLNLDGLTDFDIFYLDKLR